MMKLNEFDFTIGDLYLKENGFLSVRAYNYKGVSSWSSNKTGVTERQLFDDVTRAHKELFDYIYARYTFIKNLCFNSYMYFFVAGF